MAVGTKLFMRVTSSHVLTFSFFPPAISKKMPNNNRGGNPGWCCGFYFWLDFAATISLVPDIGWIWDPLFAAISGSGNDGGGAQDALKAGKSSRSGAKAGRVVRIVRLVRMVRMVKLYKMHGAEQGGKAERLLTQKESKVGSILSEKTTRKVIVLVLVLILFLPQFDGFNETTNTYHRGGLNSLHTWSHDMNCNSNTNAPQAAKDLTGVNSQINAPYVVDSKYLFVPLVQDYVRRVGRLIYLDISGLGASLQLDGFLSNKNSTIKMVEQTRFASRSMQGALDEYGVPPFGESVQIKYEALTMFEAPWSDVNYEVQLEVRIFLFFFLLDIQKKKSETFTRYLRNAPSSCRKT